MSKKIIKGKPFDFGYNPITEIGGDPDMLMDFGILRLKSGQVFEDNSALERAYLLVYGEITLEYNKSSIKINRPNCFDYAPWVLHLPADVPVRITGVAEDSEITVNKTVNPRIFDAKLYEPKDTPDEFRGAGTMQETSTRIVRTTFDYNNAPYANLVIGEVIGFPGKWSSYPPHFHPQPEIYYYKTYPTGGHAFAEVGDDVFKISGNDTILIQSGMTHPHVTYPGYALWYLWAIRHLDGNPYITPTFVPEHEWVAKPDAKFWSYSNKKEMK